VRPLPGLKGDVDRYYISLFSAAQQLAVVGIPRRHRHVGSTLIHLTFLDSSPHVPDPHNITHPEKQRIGSTDTNICLASYKNPEHRMFQAQGRGV
jgi:hypothetical protein